MLYLTMILLIWKFQIVINVILKKSPEKYFKYKLCGIVVDSINAIIQVFDFIINLQNYYPNGFDSTIKISDYVEFDVDRIDCTLI